jgi:hypothetical protein
MSKIERDKLLLLLDAMSKGEVTPSARVLRDYELDFANGGVSFNYGKMELRYNTIKIQDIPGE